MTSTIPKLIAAHRLAWEALQIAPDAETSKDWEEAVQEALYALCCTPVTSHADVSAMLDHLCWYIGVEEGQIEEMPRAIYAALYWGQSRGPALGLETRELGGAKNPPQSSERPGDAREKGGAH